MTVMLAARANPGSDAIAMEKIPVPEPKPIDVVVKVASAGLAPGMLRLLRLGLFTHLPTTLGHEAAGTIAALGSEVTGLNIGDRVRVHPNLNCRNCSYCRTDRDMMCAQQAMLGHVAFGGGPLYDEYHNGGLAEYVRVPFWLIDHLPESVNFDVGAKVHDLANAMRALKCAGLPYGSTLIINAATGTLGTASIRLAEHFGVSRLILVGRSSDRLREVETLSGKVHTDTVALDALDTDWATTGGLTKQLRRLAPAGADAVLDYVPEGPATGQAMAGLATGGTLVHMGASATPLPLPVIAMMQNCWRFVGTRSCTRNDAVEVLELLGSGGLNVDDLITHDFPLAETIAGVAAVDRRSEPIWMAVVRP